MIKYWKIAAVCVILAMLVLWVYFSKGISQLGNALSFAGTILTLWPTLEVLLSGRKYSSVIRSTVVPELAKVKAKAEKARVRRLTSFDNRHLFLISLGVSLVSAGFLVTILNS